MNATIFDEGSNVPLEMKGADAAPTPQGASRDLVRLAMVPGVGPRIMTLLLEYFETAQAVLAASEQELRHVEGVGPKLARAIREPLSDAALNQIFDHCQQRGVRILLRQSADYPRMFGQLPDPPPVLFVRGTLQPQDQLAVAIVGTRHASPYGKQQAERIAAGLARAGLTIVSGLARGIDAVAHRAAMSAGGRTLAFLGSGVTEIYPPEHVELADQVVQQGALVSEQPPYAKPKSGMFPQRNRLISGISLAVIVIEAAERSGALITARHAVEQDREVFALPGPVNSRLSTGCHRLIREGAYLIEGPEDVLDQLGPLIGSTQIAPDQTVRHPAELLLNEQEQAVLQAIDTQPTNIDAVVHRSGLPVSRVLSTLSVLEMRRLIRRLSGQFVQRS